MEGMVVLCKDDQGGSWIKTIKGADRLLIMCIGVLCFKKTRRGTPTSRVKQSKRPERESGYYKQRTDHAR